MRHLLITMSVLAGAVVSSCVSGTNKDVRTASGLDPQNFVSVYDGDSTALYTLKNANGMEVCITNFGGRIVSIMVPDKAGKMQDVVLGFDSVQSYFPENNQTDFGAAIGRYANRINQGKFTLDGTEYQLPRNNFGHCLHGGPDGWQYKVYDATQKNDTTLELVLHSPDGDNNFPGNVTAKVTYTLLSNNTLDIQYEATTDKETVINMTNHSYFNLSGDPSKAGTNMVLYINADNFTPVDNTFMTSGEIKSVYGTPLDFTKKHPLYETIGDSTFQQIKNARGYDHNWVLNTYKDGKGDFNKVAASLYSPESGIFLEVFTDQPGIQVYTGNFLDGTRVGKKGIKYPMRASVCLETQLYPDSPNKWKDHVKGWYNPYLEPGQKYYHHTAFKFSVK